ncbi:MAG: DinB family protein [Phototrophicaceae bacterium]
MTKDYFIELFEYTEWANQRVWKCVSTCSDEDYFKANTFSVGSIYNQLFHWMSVERWWIDYLATGTHKFPTQADSEYYRDRDELRRFWDAVHSNNMAYLHTLTVEELNRKVKPPFWNDADDPMTVSQALTQVINHSTDHRAQTMAVLHTLGYEGIGQDFLTYLHSSRKK